MFNNQQLHKYAEVLLWGLKKAKTKPFKKNSIILIRFDKLAIPLVEILAEKLIIEEMNPIIRINPTSKMEYNFFKLSKKEQLIFNEPGQEKLYCNLNGSIFINAPESITHLTNINPTKISNFAISKKKLKYILEKRELLGLFGWTLCMLPTPALAKHADMEYNDYSNQISKACFLDYENPLNQWENIFNKAKEVKKWLNSINAISFHIESKNIDLVITPGKERKWIGISGHNIPSFELFTSPDWRGTNGIYYANQPAYKNGNYVENIQLEFKNGVISKANASKGSFFLKSQIRTDLGSSRIGEFSLTDKNFSNINKFMANTLFDENYGGKFGNCHIAIGSSYIETYSGCEKTISKELKKELGFNNSSIHWDLINTEKKRVIAKTPNNKKITIYENGKFNL